MSSKGGKGANSASRRRAKGSSSAGKKGGARGGRKGTRKTPSKRRLKGSGSRRAVQDMQVPVASPPPHAEPPPQAAPGTGPGSGAADSQAPPKRMPSGIVSTILGRPKRDISCGALPAAAGASNNTSPVPVHANAPSAAAAPSVTFSSAVDVTMPENSSKSVRRKHGGMSSKGSKAQGPGAGAVGDNAGGGRVGLPPLHRRRSLTSVTQKRSTRKTKTKRRPKSAKPAKRSATQHNNHAVSPLGSSPAPPLPPRLTSSPINASPAASTPTSTSKKKKLKRTATKPRYDANGRRIYAASSARGKFARETRAARRQRLQHRTKVARELLQSEEAYVQYLNVLRTVYIAPLNNANALMQPDEASTLFSNIETLLGLNTKLLEDLRARLTKWTNKASMVGDLFVEFAPFFKMYTAYVKNYDKAINLLRTLSLTDAKSKKATKQREAFSAFLEKARQHADCGGKDLPSLLIMPVQRIPRYKLLLHELRKCTKYDHPDFKNLKKAIKLVDQAAKAVNEAIRSSQNRDTVVRISQEFSSDPGFVAPSRLFWRRGPLFKKGTKRDTKYECFLFNDLFAYASRPTPLSKLKLHRSIDINRNFSVLELEEDEDKELVSSSHGPEDDVEESALDDAVPDNLTAAGADHKEHAVPSQDYTFTIISNDKSFVCYAADADTRALWLQDFKEVLEERSRTIDLTTEYSHTAPVMARVTSKTECFVCDERFGLFRRKYYCGKGGHLVCASCSNHKLILTGSGSSQPQRVCDVCFDKIRATHVSGLGAPS